MSKKVVVAFLLGLVVATSAGILAQETSWLTGTAEQKFSKLANIQPGLGSVMAEYSTRFGNVYYAAKAGNWGMAAYQMKEMMEAQEVAENTRPQNAKMLQAFEKAALQPLARDVLKMDFKGFQNDFTSTVKQCNACHAGSGVPFIVYQLPAQPPTPAMLTTSLTFKPADLKALLGDLVP